LWPGGGRGGDALLIGADRVGALREAAQTAIRRDATPVLEGEVALELVVVAPDRRPRTRRTIGGIGDVLADKGGVGCWGI
jgi:hypothetical protein